MVQYFLAANSFSRGDSGVERTAGSKNQRGLAQHQAQRLVLLRTRLHTVELLLLLAHVLIAAEAQSKHSSAHAHLLFIYYQRTKKHRTFHIHICLPT